MSIEFPSWEHEYSGLANPGTLSSSDSDVELIFHEPIYVQEARVFRTATNVAVMASIIAYCLALWFYSGNEVVDPPEKAPNHDWLRFYGL